MKPAPSRNKTKKKTLLIQEEFIPYHMKALDSKNRITLGGKLKKLMDKRMIVEAYQIFVGKNGDILLRPTVSVPSREAWTYQNPEVIGRIRKGVEEARAGKTERVDDLESFLDTL